MAAVTVTFCCLVASMAFVAVHMMSGVSASTAAPVSQKSTPAVPGPEDPAMVVIDSTAPVSPQPCSERSCDRSRDGEVNTLPRTVYPFGPSVDDLRVWRFLDGVAGINITHSFPLAFDNYNQLWVSTNGLISFGHDNHGYIPRRFPVEDNYNYYSYYGNQQGFVLITAFWNDIDLCANDGNVYYRQTTDAGLLQRATDDVRKAYKTTNQHQTFRATWVFVATWHNVTHYRAGSSCAPVNTFQVVLVTDETISFAIMNYPSIIWTKPDNGHHHAQVGFHVDEDFYYSLPVAMTPAVADLDITSNVGEPGRYVLRVDGNADMPAHSCPDRQCPPNFIHNTTTSECQGTEYPAMGDCGPRLVGPVVEDDLYILFYCDVNLMTADPDARIKVTFLFNGAPVAGIPDQVLVAPENRAVLHEKYLSGRLPTTISCNASTFWQSRSQNSSKEVTSNSYFAGLWTSETSLRLAEADDAPTGLPLYSSLPITCTYRDNTGLLHGCSLDFQIQSSDGIAVFAKNSNGEVSKCRFSLHPEDWNSEKSFASNENRPLQFLATRDPYDLFDSIYGSVSISLHPDSLDDTQLSQKFDAEGNLYPNPWHSLTVPSVEVIRIDNNGAQCISSGDPRMTTFDGRYYNAGQTGTFLLARSHSSRGFEVHVRHWACSEFSTGCSVACAVAVQEGQYAYGIDVCNSDGIVHRLVLSNYILDYDPITTDVSRYNWKITMPSGASVEMYIFSWGRGGMNVYVNVLPRDAGKTDGLCGTFDDNRSNDFLLSDGSIVQPGNGYYVQNYLDINRFIESWRIPLDESLFLKPLQHYFGPPDFSDSIQYLCTCAFTLSWLNTDIACGFDALEDPVLKIGHPSIPIGALQPPWLNNAGSNRRRRSTSSVEVTVDIDDSYAVIDFGSDSTNQLPEDLSWPTHSNITETMATNHCEGALRNSTPYRACGDVISIDEFDAIKIKCISDIKTTGDLGWSQDKVTELQSKCLHQMFYTNSTSNSTDEILQQVNKITSSLCPEDCNGHGLCVDGICQCDSGYIGGDCSLAAGTNPTISSLLGPSQCDVRFRPCSYVRLMGTDIVSSSQLKCKVHGTKLVENGTGITFDLDFSGLKVSSHEVQCPLPAIMQDENALPAYEYNVSVSNDGLTFSSTELYNLIKYDSACVSCDSEHCGYMDNGCLIAGSCFAACQVNPFNSTEECNPSLLARAWSSLNAAPCEWSRWTLEACSKSCDYGLEHKSRRCLVELCDGKAVETTVCNDFNCQELEEETEQGVLLKIRYASPSEFALKEIAVLNLTTSILNEYCVERTSECCGGFHQNQSTGSGLSFLTEEHVYSAKGFPRKDNANTHLRLLTRMSMSALVVACGSELRHRRDTQASDPNVYLNQKVMTSAMKGHLVKFEQILGRGVSIVDDADQSQIVYIAAGAGGAALLVIVIGICLAKTKKHPRRAVSPDPRCHDNKQPDDVSLHSWDGEGL